MEVRDFSDLHKTAVLFATRLGSAVFVQQCLKNDIFQFERIVLRPYRDRNMGDAARSENIPARSLHLKRNAHLRFIGFGFSEA